MKEKIQKAYLSGKYYRYKDLCRDLNVSWPTVKKYTKGLDDLREMYIKTMGPNIVSDYTMNDFVSLSALAEKYSITRTLAYEVLNYYGTPVKSRSKSNRRCELNENIFNSINDESAYWLGFIWGDGSVNDRTLRVKLAIKDIDHLMKLKTFLGSSHKIQHYPETGLEGAVALDISNQHLVDCLKRFNILPNKTYDHDFNFNDLPDLYLSDFWRGFFDADGCFSKQGNYGHRLHLCSYRKPILNKWQAWVKPLGVNRPIKLMNNSYEMSIYKKEHIRNVLEAIHMYTPNKIKLSRKYKLIESAGLRKE